MPPTFILSQDQTLRELTFARKRTLRKSEQFQSFSASLAITLLLAMCSAAFPQRLMILLQPRPLVKPRPGATRVPSGSGRQKNRAPHRERRFPVWVVLVCLTSVRRNRSHSFPPGTSRATVRSSILCGSLFRVYHASTLCQICGLSNASVFAPATLRAAVPSAPQQRSRSIASPRHLSTFPLPQNDRGPSSIALLAVDPCTPSPVVRRRAQRAPVRRRSSVVHCRSSALAQGHTSVVGRPSSVVHRRSPANFVTPYPSTPTMNARNS